MATYRYVNIELPEAKRLADLYGIGYDLAACRDYCEKYLKVLATLRQQPPDLKHLECFSVYVFVKYGRCFKGGVRHETAKQLIANLSPEDKEFHQFVLDIRDKYITHSVNDLETHKVRVWLNPEEKGKKINDVNMESHYVAGFKSADIERLRNLAEKLLAKVKSAKKEEEKKLTELVCKTFDLGELYSRDAEAPPDIDYRKVTKSRELP